MEETFIRLEYVLERLIKQYPQYKFIEKTNECHLEENNQENLISNFGELNLEEKNVFYEKNQDGLILICDNQTIKIWKTGMNIKFLETLFENGSCFCNSNLEERMRCIGCQTFLCENCLENGRRGNNIYCISCAFLLAENI